MFYQSYVKIKAFKQLQYLYEDEQMLIVNKPEGILVIPGPSPNQLSLKEYLERERNILVVHRIDMPTSGIVVFAKTEEAHKALNEQFQERTVEKEYLALVEGRASEDEFEISFPILQDSGLGSKVKVHPKGKDSLTLVETIERFRRHSWLKCKPITGRTHQIRVHLATYNLPIVGDQLYGSAEGIKLSSLKRNYNIKKWEEERPFLRRMALHASGIKLKHPIKEESFAFSADLPKELSGSLKILRKYGS